jgi:hypothetical protein
MTTAINANDAALSEHEYPEEMDDNAFVAALMEDVDPEGDEDAPVRKLSKKETDAEEDNENDNGAEDEASEDDAQDEPSDDEDENEGDEDKENDEDEDDKPKRKFADDSDETYVKVKEGDTEHEVKVSDLKRLFGQEASLTRKSQEVATEREAVNAKRTENVTAYNALLQRATSRADKYRALPWTQYMKDPNIPADQLQALTAEANEAIQEETFIKNELTSYVEKITAEQKEAAKKQSAECIKAIKNPESPTHIKGWNDALYADIRNFAVEQGFDAKVVTSLNDPAAFKVLHMAMQFKKGATKVLTKKVNKTPTRIVKNSSATPAVRDNSKKLTAKTAVQKAVRSGSMDDAANAFFAMDGDE